MHHVLPNYRNKEALLMALYDGVRVMVVSDDGSQPPTRGEVDVEGPHGDVGGARPWSATVRVRNGRVVGVRSINGLAVNQ